MKKSKVGRKKRNPRVTPGFRYWGCYKPGKRNLYQLQEVINKYGGVTAVSPWMELKEVRTFIRGWRSSGGRKKLPIFRRQK